MSDPSLPGHESSQPTPSLPSHTPSPAQPSSGSPAAPVASPAAPPAHPAPALPAAPPAPPAGGSHAGGFPYTQQAPPGGPLAPVNTLSIVALIGGILFNIVGIICGHIALGQIKRSGERGRGLALAGTIIGYVSLVGTVLATIFLFVFAGLAVTAASQSAASSLTELEDVAAELDSALPTPEDLPADSATAELERSPEFCAALNTALGAERDPNTIERSPEEIAAYAALAAIDSPHQEVYQKFAEFAKDPSLLTRNTDFAAVLGDFSTVMFEDALACA